MKRQFHRSFDDAPNALRLMDRIGAVVRPSSPGASPSSFSSWVYELEMAGKDRVARPISKVRRARSLTEGKFAHRDIERFRLWYNRDHRDAFSPSEWDLEFADDQEEGKGRSTFLAGCLRVGREPLVCVPDVVLCHRRSSARLVIERKTTMAFAQTVPEGGWPRLGAQLWCYGWIDDWLDAPEVYLVGQIWSRRSRGPGHFQMTWAKPRWRRSDRTFHRNWAEVFAAYGGTLHGAALEALAE